MSEPEFNDEARRKLEEYLATHHLPAGLGKKEEACSVAAINLALTGDLTDRIPDCMSLVIGRWIIRIQDAMPDDMRNSQEWKSLLPLAAGTGRGHERERRQIVIEWLWETVMPSIQPYADRIGMGDDWRQLIEKRDYDTAIAVRHKADKHWRADAVAVAAVAAAVAAAVDAAAVAVDAVAAAADAVAADAVADAVAAAVAAVADARFAYWRQINPCGLLRKLIELAEGVPPNA